MNLRGNLNLNLSLDLQDTRRSVEQSVRGLTGCRVVWLCGVIIVGMVTMSADVASAQYGGGEETGRSAGVTAPEKPKPTSGPETNFIPSLSVQERYDSNVYFIPGRKLEDYVTTFSPQLRVDHKNPLVDATVTGGADAEIFVKNPGLNYVAGNGSVDLNLSGLTNTLVRGLGLRLFDAIRYTPQPPAFAAPTGGSQLPEAFVIGIQAQRANSFSNAGRAEGSYAISPILSLTSTYSDQRIRFGRIQSPAGGGGLPAASFISTNFQTVKSGPVLKASPVDTLTLSHQYQKGTFTRQGITSGFSTQGIIAGWTRLLTPTLTASVMGGITVFDRTGNVQYLGSASLSWKGEATDVAVSYSRAVMPSFFVASTPLLSQIVNVTVNRRLTEALSLSINGNYAHSESVPDSSLLQFDSYAVTPGISYQINRMLTANLSYTNTMFDRRFGGQGSSFDRDMVLMKLAAEWN